MFSDLAVSLLRRSKEGAAYKHKSRRKKISHKRAIESRAGYVKRKLSFSIDIEKMENAITEYFSMTVNKNIEIEKLYNLLVFMREKLDERRTRYVGASEKEIELDESEPGDPDGSFSSESSVDSEDLENLSTYLDKIQYLISEVNHGRGNRNVEPDDERSIIESILLCVENEELEIFSLLNETDSKAFSIREILHWQ